mmetsp:Transcript_54211/g.115723  ORF Transcript_54211/g.115723 Transcript_54211/m.115723 type:complete len:96 (+) Transcript_54211:229-516(+)
MSNGCDGEPPSGFDPMVRSPTVYCIRRHNFSKERMMGRSGLQESTRYKDKEDHTHTHTSNTKLQQNKSCVSSTSSSLRLLHDAIRFLPRGEDPLP